jgi:hypothetical protein
MTIITTVGILLQIVLICVGIAIIGWDIGKLKQARDSRDWPQVEGTVVHSSIGMEKYKKLNIIYTYTVANNTYTSGQISFDTFENPGGQGRNETIIARYPRGQKVTVYYDPLEPATAVLEPEDYSPFLMPLFFGALFIFLPLLILVPEIRRIQHGWAARPPDMSTPRRIMGTVIGSVVLYGALVLTLFGSGTRETHIRVFGNHPLGMPNIVFVVALQTLLCLPMPWVIWHWLRLAFQALQDGRTPGLFYLLTVDRSHPELWLSQLVCAGGLLYIIAVLWALVALLIVSGL